ncbi:hypothetical protein EGI22_06795 [Lacihabitans sp. LS3-19]|uniref:hypothetical protein n=1 Tax=Lacihabitans sp. LS3-19 TaxID=2487335 RepID=UPI0020CFC329|nr:hypothetical protein [Lacihabitans sp. LS3-19]MCP9767614.1 hypothetical protein [Lacihabitans sp. LS3-19]
MTPIKNNTFLKKVKDITVSGSLAMLVLGTGIYGCSPNNTEGDYEQSEVYNQGVRTYIKEISKGEFKITEEIIVPADSSKAYVTYLDGHEEILTKDQAKDLIDDEITHNPTRVGHHNGLSNVLLYGGLGYFLGRTSRPNYGYYRPDFRDQSNNYTPSGGVKNNSDMGKYYSNPETFAKSTAVNRSVYQSRTRAARPSGSRSVFFGSRSRSGFGG